MINPLFHHFSFYHTHSLTRIVANPVHLIGQQVIHMLMMFGDRFLNIFSDFLTSALNFCLLQSFICISSTEPTLKFFMFFDLITQDFRPAFIIITQ